MVGAAVLLTPPACEATSEARMVWSSLTLARRDWIIVSLDAGGVGVGAGGGAGLGVVAGAEVLGRTVATHVKLPCGHMSEEGS